MGYTVKKNHFKVDINAECIHFKATHLDSGILCRAIGIENVSISPLRMYIVARQAFLHVYPERQVVYPPYSLLIYFV